MNFSNSSSVFFSADVTFPGDSLGIRDLRWSSGEFVGVGGIDSSEVAMFVGEFVVSDVCVSVEVDAWLPSLS